MIGKFNSETQTNNENIWTPTYIWLLPCTLYLKGNSQKVSSPTKKKLHKITLIFILKMTSTIKSNQYTFLWQAFILKCVFKKLHIRKIKTFKEKNEQEKQQ